MVNVFSFCLYGPENPKYYKGLLENVYLAGKYFPDWKVYVYYGTDVEPGIIDHLGLCTSVVLRPTGLLGAPNMIQRFFAIDEPGIDVMMVRDADSRIHWKDRWAIRDFLAKPEFVAHTIRDHKEHTAKLMGGLWGLRKSSGLNMKSEYMNYREDTSLGHRLAHDQNFLGDVIYPKVLDQLLVHYSFHKRINETNTVLFPFEWSGDVFCGRTEDVFYDIPQPSIKRTPLIPEVHVRVRESPSETPPAFPSEVKVVPPQSSNIQPLNFLRRK